MNDADLIARTLGGDQAAFERLIRRHFRALHAVVLAHIHDLDEADDVCQDALIRAWRRLAQCRDRDRFPAWLLRIGRNEARRRLAFRSLRRWVGLDEVTSSEMRQGPESDLERAEQRRYLLHGLARLRSRHREVVLLFDLEGYSHREIAQLLRVSEAMSRRLLSDARRRLREVLGDLEGKEGDDGPD